MNNLFLYLLGVFASFFAPIADVMGAILVLMAIDFVCGVVAARTRGEKFRSAKVKQSVVKLFLYLVAIITAHLVGTVFLPVIPWVNITLGIMGATEIISIFENISAVTGTNFVRAARDAIMRKLGKDDKKIV